MTTTSARIVAIVALIVAFLLGFLTGSNSIAGKGPQDLAVEACLAHGGIPIFSSYADKVTDCLNFKDPIHRY